MIEKRGFTIQESARIIYQKQPITAKNLQEVIHEISEKFKAFGEWIGKVFENIKIFFGKNVTPFIKEIMGIVEKNEPKGKNKTHQFLNTEKHLYRQSNIYHKCSKININFKGVVPNVPIQSISPRFRLH